MMTRSAVSAADTPLFRLRPSDAAANRTGMHFIRESPARVAGVSEKRCGRHVSIPAASPAPRELVVDASRQINSHHLHHPMQNSHWTRGLPDAYGRNYGGQCTQPACSKARCVYWVHRLTLYQRAPDRLWLLAAQDQRRRDRAVPGDGVHDRFKLLWRWHEDLENETILSGQPQHLHDVRHFGKLLQAGLNMFVGRAQTDDRHHPQPERGRIDLGGIAGDDSALLQPLDPLRGRGLREPDPAPKFRYCDTPIFLQDFDDCDIGRV